MSTEEECIHHSNVYKSSAQRAISSPNQAHVRRFGKEANHALYVWALKMKPSTSLFLERSIVTETISTAVRLIRMSGMHRLFSALRRALTARAPSRTRRRVSLGSKPELEAVQLKDPLPLLILSFFCVSKSATVSSLLKHKQGRKKSSNLILPTSSHSTILRAGRV